MLEAWVWHFSWQKLYSLYIKQLEKLNFDEVSDDIT